MDELQANLREQTIQNHRLISEVGELGIRISHHLEDLTKARAERDQFQADYKNASERLAALGEELKDVRTKYEAIKLSILAPPQARSISQYVAKSLTLNRSSITSANATRMNEISGYRRLLSMSMNSSWNPRDIKDHRTTIHHLRTGMHTGAQQTILLDCEPAVREWAEQPAAPLHCLQFICEHKLDMSICGNIPSPSPSFQAELQATGVHSTPWSQPAIYSLQPRPVSPRSTTPTMLDSQRTPDPRKRIKLDANQTTPPAHFATPTRGIPTLNDKNSTPTTTTTTHITQISSTTTNSPKRPRNTPSMLTPSRAIPLPSTPQGCRIPSEVRKRTISLRARPLRFVQSSSRDRKGPQPDEREAGEVFEDDPVEARPGYNSSSSESP